MSKRQFIAPYILLSGGEGSQTGTGSGQGGSDPVPVSFAAWLESVWRADIIADGTIDEEDYATWWESNGFSQEDWNQLNPDLPWDDYFGD